MGRNQRLQIALPLKAAVAAAVTATLAALGMVLAGSAQGYPPVSCSVTVTPQTLVGGHPIRVTGTSNVSEKWTVTFNGVTHHYVGKQFSDRYATPKVQKTTVIKLIVRCSGSLGDQTRAYNVTLLPVSSGSGVLPDTGGPNLWLLVAALVAAGSGAVLMMLRRRAQPAPASGPRRASRTRR